MLKCSVIELLIWCIGLKCGFSVHLHQMHFFLNKSCQTKAIKCDLTSVSSVVVLQEEMHSCGISFQQYTGDDCWVNLSYTMVAFTKQLMSFLEEGLKLYFPELHMVLLESLREIILVAVQHVDYSHRCEQDPDKKTFVLQNASFLHDTVLPVVERRFEESVGKPAKQLRDLRKSTRSVRVNPESTTSLV